MIWSANLAYVVGLIATDGNLSNDGRHINFTSKDIDQIETFTKILNINSKIAKKKSGYNPAGLYYQLQFGNILLYKFLLSIGLTPNKTKTLGPLEIPEVYFADFLRGSLDGDGFTYSYWDKRWKNSYMLYLAFTSASLLHLEWVRERISTLYKINGKIRAAGKSAYQLVFAKRNSLVLIDILYYNENIPSLLRKRVKILKALDIVKQQTR